RAWRPRRGVASQTSGGIGRRRVLAYEAHVGGGRQEGEVERRAAQDPADADEQPEPGRVRIAARDDREHARHKPPEAEPAGPRPEPEAVGDERVGEAERNAALQQRAV